MSWYRNEVGRLRSPALPRYLLLLTRLSWIWRSLRRKRRRTHSVITFHVFRFFPARAELAGAPACIIIPEQLSAHLFCFPTFPLSRRRGISLWFGRSYDDDDDDNDNVVVLRFVSRTETAEIWMHKCISAPTTVSAATTICSSRLLHSRRDSEFLSSKTLFALWPRARRNFSRLEFRALALGWIRRRRKIPDVSSRDAERAGKTEIRH